MNILFITKPFIIEPLGLLYISAAAKREGHKTSLALTTDDLESRLKEVKPDIIAYSVMTGDHRLYADLNRRLKESHNFLSVFGGPHPTFFPAMIKEDGVDIICRGEGEQAFAELLNTIELGSDFRNIRNLYVKHGGDITENEVRPLAEINSISVPDRKLMRDLPEILAGPIKHFIASRGCPYNCSYCFNEKYAELYKDKSKRVRFRDVGLLLDEIKSAINPDTKVVYFQDDTFTVNRDWLSWFSYQYKTKIGLPFHCHVRPNTLDETVVKLLKESGCHGVHIAAETEDYTLRKNVLNRNMTKAQILDAVNLLKKNGIKVMLQNIIGLPGGSLEKDLRTLDMNIAGKPDYAWVSIYQPYPGTRLGDYCKEQGYYDGDIDTIGPNFFDKSRITIEDKHKIERLQKLFAIAVEHPYLRRSGLLDVLIGLPLDFVYKRMYKSFRAKADERLYGVKL